MRRLLHAVLAVALVTLAWSVVAAAPQGAGSTQEPRQIPGLTTADQFPRGCVDCHIDRPDVGMDTRLSTNMQQWQAEVPPELLARVKAFSPAGMSLTGAHPASGDVASSQIPTSCLTCHAQASTIAPPFNQLLHGLHLTGEGNHFLTMFQGECTHCHKLDKTTGSWSMGSGAETG